MNKIGPITGTFIDEITYNIPSANWSFDQWRKDLDYMQEIGIDTIIFIRGGFEDQCVFPSKVLNTPYSDDLAGLIFEETSKRGMKVYFGLYISNLNWNDGDVAGEVKINKLFIDEVLERYGHYPSFEGWYIPHEFCKEAKGTLNFGDILRDLPRLCKDKTPDKKVLVSPFFCSHFVSKTPLTPDEHYEEWDRMLSVSGKEIDICAFQDGTAPMNMMSDYFIKTKEFCRKYNIEHWVNAETFHRDVKASGSPIPFNILKRRLEMHKEYADKIITFEFSHFLSPQSMYPSARNLSDRYREYYLK